MDLFRRQCFTREVIATRVEALFCEGRIYFQKVLQLVNANGSVLHQVKKMAPHLSLLYDFGHMRLLRRVETRKVHGRYAEVRLAGRKTA